jgi:hypothetical protein
MSMANLPARAQIDQAESLTFPERAPETTITIHAAIEGWPIDVACRGKLEQLPAALARLTAAGLTPAQPSTSAGQQKPAKPRQERVEPIYLASGEACCPTHKKPLKEGQYGLFCTAKDPEGKNGYCSLKFAE